MENIVEEISVEQVSYDTINILVSIKHESEYDFQEEQYAIKSNRMNLLHLYESDSHDFLHEVIPVLEDKLLGKEIDCVFCEGEGTIESPSPSCSRPISDCCGGCFTYSSCPDCDGDKVITIDELTFE